MSVLRSGAERSEALSSTKWEGFPKAKPVDNFDLFSPGGVRPGRVDISFAVDRPGGKPGDVLEERSDDS